MRIEPLEQRALLSVSVIEETFKDLDFTAKANVAGTSTVDVQGEPVQISLNGKATLSGTIVYTSRDFGGIQGGALSAIGTWKGGNHSGMWGIDGYPNPIMDEDDQLTGSVVIDQSYVNPGGDKLNGTYDLTNGFFKSSDFSMGMDLTSSDGMLTFNNGKLTPTEKKAFDVVVTPAWNDNGVNVDVEVPGKVHKSNKVDRSVPVTFIELYWAKGASFSKRVSNAFADKIPIYWNQAAGQYEVTDLPSAPVGATHLLFVAKFDGKTKVAPLGLPTVSVANTSVVEGDPRSAAGNDAVFTVTLSRKSSLPVTVYFYTGKGTATSGVDYVGTLALPPFDWIVIPAGETQGEIKVPIKADTIYEPTETFSLLLANVVNARVARGHGKALGSIVNDDPLPSISINDVTLAEGNLGTTHFNFTVTLSNASQMPVSVKYSTAPGSAKAEKDYVAWYHVKVPFAPGVTSRTAKVLVKGDKTHEENETFFVNLAQAKGAAIADAQGAGTITNDEPVPAISIDDLSRKEGNSENIYSNVFHFTARLSNPSDRRVLFWARVEDGSAEAPWDYVVTPVRNYWFEPGKTTVTVFVRVKGDKVVEDDETFYVKLYDASGWVTIADDEALGTIINDDGLTKKSGGARNAAIAQFAGRAELAASFEPLGRKKSSDRATDLILATQ